jgi:hypothetical protein
MFIVILVLFVMTMFIWLLSLLGASEAVVKYSPWLAWFACLFLGIIVFLVGSGLVKPMQM